MLYPMFSMVLLTLAVGVIALKTRFDSVKKKEISPRYYLTMKAEEGEIVPEFVHKTTRLLNNMFEIPVLFYVAGTLAIAMEVESTAAVITAWIFIASRIFHAWIYLTYNNLMHRMQVFWVGVVSVVVLWILLLIA